jgi:hypothetical protein
VVEVEGEGEYKVFGGVARWLLHATKVWEVVEVEYVWVENNLEQTRTLV